MPIVIRREILRSTQVSSAGKLEGAEKEDLHHVNEDDGHHEVEPHRATRG